MIGKLTALLLLCCGSSFGQMFVRIDTLDGSLDKPWLLLPPFWIPPFSIVPAAMWYFKKIAPGKGGSVVDFSMWISIATNLIPIITSKISILGDFTKPLVDSLTILIIMSIVLYIREDKLCTNSNTSNNSNAKPSIIRAVRNAALISGISSVLPMAVDFIPIIGTAISALSTISPTIGTLVSSTIKAGGTGFGVLLLNMYEASFTGTYCADSINGGLAFLVIMGSLGTSIGIEYFQNLQSSVVSGIIGTAMDTASGVVGNLTNNNYDNGDNGYNNGDYDGN